MAVTVVCAPALLLALAAAAHSDQVHFQQL
eukprot:COSAG01_NODE_19563_length_1003_cov_1.363938_1_plen_29_part_10